MCQDRARFFSILRMIDTRGGVKWGFFHRKAKRGVMKHERRLSATISLRYFVAGAIGVIVIAYVIALVTGLLNGKIDFSAITLILLAALAIALLVSPRGSVFAQDLLTRLQSIQIASLKFELAQVRAQQVDQRSKLELISLLLPLVLTETERRHLTNLAEGNTNDYVGNHNLRKELRRLRYLTLINNPHEPIGSASDGRRFDLKDLVQLTPLGIEWAQQIEQMTKTRAKEGASGEETANPPHDAGTASL